MAYYLVRATVKQQHKDELYRQLQKDAYLDLQPFGRSLTKGLRGMRIEHDDVVIWEEEDYCTPPLAMERAAVLDRFFDDIRVEAVQAGESWRQIQTLPKLFPDLDEVEA